MTQGVQRSQGSNDFSAKMTANICFGIKIFSRDVQISKKTEQKLKKKIVEYRKMKFKHRKLSKNME